jgi:hypothetical protein
MQTFLYGAFGAVLYELVLFWSKRFSAPLLTFNLWQYVVIMAIYLPAAGFAATLYPYDPGPTPWKAVLVGFGLPTILSAAVSVSDRAGRRKKAKTRLRGPALPSTGRPAVRVPGSILDLIALY